jgi:hypothetical protein
LHYGRLKKIKRYYRPKEKERYVEEKFAKHEGKSELQNLEIL